MHLFVVTLERNEPPISLVVAQFSNEQTFESLLEHIYNGYAVERLRASALVLRPDVRDQLKSADIERAKSGEPTAKSPFLRALAAACGDPKHHFARFADVPISLLYAEDYAHRLTSNINPLAQPSEIVREHLAHGESIRDIMNAEMRYIVGRSRALLLPVGGSYYRNPSHRPANSFLRVGNIQYSRQAIDAMTFWLLPSLVRCKAILVDTWSLSSLAFNASRVLATARGEAPVPVEMLSQYQDASVERQAELSEVLERLVSDMPEISKDSHIPMTCIVSATHTGSLVTVLQEQIELSALPIDVQFITVFQLGSDIGLPALCDLSDDPEFSPLSEDDTRHRSAIVVDPQVYFPMTYIDVPLMIRKPEADHFRPFLDMVVGREILSAHRDQPSDGPTRHHAIHVDTERLASLPEFDNAFCAELAELHPIPSVVLTPQHSAARILGARACAFIQEAHGARPTLVEHSNLQLGSSGPRRVADEKVREVLTGVPETSSILVLDDCFVTGARMTGYQTRLRQLATRARLHYLVGLARAENPTTWQNFARLLRYRAPSDRHNFHSNTVRAIFEITLPNWQVGRCPWCEEGLLYESLEQSGGRLPDEIRMRQSVLVDRDTGLRDNLFVEHGSASKIKLYSGSVFAPEGSTQAEVFAAVAAAIQRLRVDANGERPVLGPRRYPIATVLDAEHYLNRTYTDSIIRASFLRGATWEELVCTSAESEEMRERFITNIVTAPEDDVRNLTLELVVAEASRKCQIPGGVHMSSLGNVASGLLTLVRAHAGRKS